MPIWPFKTCFSAQDDLSSTFENNENTIKPSEEQVLRLEQRNVTSRPIDYGTQTDRPTDRQTDMGGHREVTTPIMMCSDDVLN